jgi:hypothetical protein
MNYKKHYELLITRGKNRVLEGYVERHHIIPRCMGGTDDAENIVQLTPEEHYLAHQLLVKMYPNHSGLIRSAHMMAVTNSKLKRNNKSFGWIRRQNALIMSQHMKEYINTFGHPKGRAGKTNTKESNKKRSDKMLGVSCPSRGVKGPRGSRKSLPKVICRLDNKKELDIANFIAYCKRLDNPEKAKFSDMNRSESQKAIPKPQPTVQCPHCHKFGGKNVMQRHHFNNCRIKNEQTTI